MKIEPKGVTVLIKPKKVDDKSAGGILIPVSVRNREQAAVTEGEVIAIGPSAWADYEENDGVQVGDWVAYAQYAGHFIADPEGKDRDGYVIVNDQDIKAVIHKGDDNA